MKNIKTSSNKSFGIVFFIVFIIISLYPLVNQEDIRIWSLFIAFIFLILALLNSKILTPMNKIWTRFGLFLGNFISPIVMGIIFFFRCYTNRSINETIWKGYFEFKEK